MSEVFHWVALALAILMTAISQVLLKIGACRDGGSLNLITFTGLGMFGLVTILIVFSLQGISLKMVMALNSLTFIATPLAALIFLGEQPKRMDFWSGGLIILGILIFSLGG
jgi:drug/metabolite transporter (DMT)-like permease